MRPLLQRRPESIVQRFLGGVEVAEEPNQGGKHAARLGTVDAVHDLALDQKQTFLMDGTLSNYDRAAQNINRSLSRNRPVLIFYVYQKPEVAWKFTEARKITEGRNIPKDVFIERFLNARDVINRVRKDFDKRVIIYLVKKNFETHEVENVIKIEKDGPGIDHYIQERYTKDDLKKLL